jgi:catechol 2,3-dioxygenase-like lactoylglutathione lyase family enzyme
MLTVFNHTSFTVPDLDVAVRFWSETMGLEARDVSRRTGRWQEAVTGVECAELRIAHLYGRGIHIELIEYEKGAIHTPSPSPAATCAGHICFECTGIEREWDRLMAAGCKPQGRVTEVDNGPAKGCKAAYLRDPSGIILELVELTAK